MPSYHSYKSYPVFRMNNADRHKGKEKRKWETKSLPSSRHLEEGRIDSGESKEGNFVAYFMPDDTLTRVSFIRIEQQ